MRNFGPCMCGGIDCPSCGPAQGNYRCPVCGKWAFDGGCDDPDKCMLESEKRDKEEAIYFEREELQNQLIAHYAKQDNCDFWDVDEDIRFETRNLSVEELRERVKALN